MNRIKKIISIAFCTTILAASAYAETIKTIDEVYAGKPQEFIYYKFVQQPLTISHKLILAASSLLGLAPGVATAIKAENKTCFSSRIMYTSSIAAALALPIVAYKYYIKKMVNQRILKEFLDHWNYYKEFTPKDLHEKIDELSKEYENGENWNEIKKRASQITDEIRSSVTHKFAKFDLMKRLKSVQ
jgi:hypothetical protein